ncbi:MAG: UDP-3-O-(3-hydroxymyristoyl)glucosamine N-acyltransferase [Gammaproteobacteria bacterium]
MSENKEYTLAEIAKHTDSLVVGDSTAIVNNLSTLETASTDSLSFLSNLKYAKFTSTSKAGAIIVHESFEIKDSRNYIVSPDPYLAYAKASSLFKRKNFELDNASIHPSASISNDSVIGKNVLIGANVVIGPNCEIGNNVVIKSNCSIVQDVKIGDNSIIHNGTVLGSDGFGYAPTKDGYVKIEQVGKLVIEKNVEIGANCTIDRGAILDTEIHDGVKLDNQIHIAHNVIIGKNSAIAASCAVAGSTVIGKNFQMGGLSGILGHLNICDNVTVGAHTLITKDIKKSGNYVGIMPAQEQKDWAKSSVYIKKRGK